MRDAVLHNINQISLFGLKEVNPGLISAFLVTGGLLLAAALIRIFAIRRFRYASGTLRWLVEEALGRCDRLARGCGRQRCGFVGA